jgi:hypothetical protein
MWFRVNKTVADRFPRISKNRAVYRYREFVGTVFGWKPDRFIYRARPVLPGTGRTGPVPTGFANPEGLFASMGFNPTGIIDVWRKL